MGTSNDGEFVRFVPGDTFDMDQLADDEVVRARPPDGWEVLRVSQPGLHNESVTDELHRLNETMYPPVAYQCDCGRTLPCRHCEAPATEGSRGPSITLPKYDDRTSHCVVTATIEHVKGEPYRWVVEADFGTQGFNVEGSARTYVGARIASGRAARRALTCP